MANVLTDLAADIYKAADIVGRELVGFIPSATVNAGTERAAKGQQVRSFYTRAATVVNSTPSMTIPEGNDQTIDNKAMTLTKERAVQIPWTGEDIRFVQGGAGYETIYGDQIAQAMRALVNEMESDLAIEAYTNASRAVGAAGTNPFASNFDVIAEARQILADNGMPVNDGRSTLVINTIAGTKLRNLATLQSVSDAGNDQLLRRGTLLDLQGVMLKESAQVKLHTKGTATGLDALAAYAAGITSIGLDGGDGGSLLAGDVVTFAGDTNKYVVNTGFTAAAGTAVIGGPGLRQSLALGVEMTIGNTFTANVLMHQAALELAMRAPASPLGGDAAVDVMIVQDPTSGLVFEISVYKGFKKALINVGVIYGYKAWKPDAIALVLG